MNRHENKPITLQDFHFLDCNDYRVFPALSELLDLFWSSKSIKQKSLLCLFAITKDGITILIKHREAKGG